LAISNYIRETLLFYNSAVLPGFGAFEIVNESAEVKAGSMKPPKPMLVFNKENTLNDNILSSKIVEAEDVSSEEAHQKIQEFIDEIRFSLNKRESFVIEGVGVLSQDENNVYHLEKDVSLNIDLENYGLDSFELDPSAEEEPSIEKVVKAEKKMETPVVKKQEEIPVPSEEVKKQNRNTVWVLSGSVVVVLLAFIIIALTTDLFDNNLGISKLFNDKENVLETDQSYTSIDENDFDFDEMVNELEGNIDSMTSMENALDFTNSEAVNEASDNVYAEYHLICGSFSSKKNAESLSQQLTLQGFPAIVIDRGDGFYRVSAISYRDKQQALTELFKFRKRKDMKNAWLLGLK
jgi:SPOR domain/CCDC81-like prokaryotic HU domain 2/CCDC81-like prokaryotic HU domain 1